MRNTKQSDDTINAIRAGADTRAKVAAALGIPLSSAGARVVRLVKAGWVSEHCDPLPAVRVNRLVVNLAYPLAPQK